LISPCRAGEKHDIRKANVDRRRPAPQYASWWLAGREENEDMNNTSGLGVGWHQKCLHCGRTFTAYSHKQVFCCTECSFMGRIKKTDSGCWEWQGNKNTQGYGVLSVKQKDGFRKTVSAHRYSYERHNGEIPTEMCVCHKCDNPSCVNPEHLFLGTKYVNNHDRSLKGRSGSRVFSDTELEAYSLRFRGAGNASAKLNDALALEIYNDSSMSYSQLARVYGVAKCTVTAIKNKRNWKHIHDTAQPSSTFDCFGSNTERTLGHNSSST
jgi:hypothetical protein